MASRCTLRGGVERHHLVAPGRKEPPMASTPQAEAPRLSPREAGEGWLSRTFLPPWWLLLITGISWTVIAIVLLRFDYTSVYSISLLFGFVALAAGVFEVAAVFMVAGWWKLLHAVLAAVFLIAGVVSFTSPGNTFVSLAAVFSFFLVFAGTFDIITSISNRKVIEVWWLQLIGGIIELALGFWAAGYYGRSAVLLVAWVAAFAIIRGVRDIVTAFRVRELQHPSPAR
jgi:uncharacterized membrane protein HdeD (DUF308 family)